MHPRTLVICTAARPNEVLACAMYEMKRNEMPHSVATSLSARHLWRDPRYSKA